MSAHRLLRDLFLDGAPSDTPDPGASGTIYADRQLGRLALVSLAAETRTLAVPTKAGIYLMLYMKTDGGDITLTATSGYDEAGNTSIVFSATGQYALFVSVEEGSTYRWRLVSYDGVSGPGLSIDGVALAATAQEINNVADRSANVIVHTTGTLAVTEVLHHNKVIVLDLAGGIAVTLPTAAAGLKFTFIVKTTFTGAASIKSATGADVMIGHAIMGNNTDNSVVNWQAVAGSTIDTIDLLGTSNSTGGMAGQVIEIVGLAANLWFVKIIGDAAGTEATPFADTVA